MTQPALAYLPSPIGPLEIQGSDAGVAAIRFLNEPVASVTLALPVPSCLHDCHQQLKAYFGGELRDFTLTYDVRQGTEFQRRVWTVLTEIGFGQTASYLDLARKLNNPGAVRAVGAANGQNPLSIVWPCHRIIGSGGQLTGYAGGMSRKRWLLDLEKPPAQLGLF
ncbi:methylated-DNA--[protein]-cysteine S-methyltransferase [Hymenobacter sp. BT175]|uniref:methylated-DNA--[protein]-cysteine S-methyltransferase n=1 Tax=Hymenobacter translucens TaxID=2886507 RepID=UPI001D0DE81A|nr:methylated-DNA--[protein]-cysteine S-methyltransferase [Hymenobacter translucens]MCC2548872.1 methylated-DNA--[protein]-cysteine S-methyltransferase [Hymenobacter translucens]